MLDTVKIPRALVKRADKLAAKSRRTREKVLKSALEKGLDYDEWFVGQVEAGIAEADRGELVSHEAVVAGLEKLSKGFVKKQRKAA